MSPLAWFAAALTTGNGAMATGMHVDLLSEPTASFLTRRSGVSRERMVGRALGDRDMDGRVNSSRVSLRSLLPLAEDPMIKAPPLEPYRVEIAHEAQKYQDGEQVRALWMAVLWRTRRDIIYLRRYSASDDLDDHERVRQRDILRSCPGEFPEGSTCPFEFLASEWFLEVCRFLNREPAALRAALEGEEL